jgi:hypothetical protein
VASKFPVFAYGFITVILRAKSSNRRRRLWDVFRGVFCTHFEIPSHDSSSSNLPMQLSPAPHWAFGNETPHATVHSSREGRLTGSLLKGGTSTTQLTPRA